MSAGRLAWAIGAATSLVVLAVPFLPEDAARPQVGPATVPDRMAGYSYLTADVSDSPPGRAVALFQHGFGVEFLDFPQAIVVGADADVYRRVDEAEDRGGPETQGDPAPMLLSPDGTQVAVGSHDTKQPDVALVDLSSGHTTLHRLRAGRSVVPLAWSADGQQLAYLFNAKPTNPHRGVRIAGKVGLLDLRTGKAEALPGASQVWTAAFSPDGKELAVQHSRHAGAALEVHSLVGEPPRVVEAPRGHLDGPAAWSPNGRLLVIARGQWPTTEISFVDATGRDDSVPDPIPLDVFGNSRVLGWTAPDEVAVLAGDHLTAGGIDPETYWLTSVPVNGGDPRRISAMPGGSNYGVGRFHLASALVPDLRVRPASDIDRGPAPMPVRVAVALLAGLAVAAIANFALRRRRL